MGSNAHAHLTTNQSEYFLIYNIQESAILVRTIIFGETKTF
jgi:hypothetical protein